MLVYGIHLSMFPPFVINFSTKYWIVVLCLVLLTCSNHFVNCGKSWNSDKPLPISELSVIKNKEFAFHSLAMPVSKRGDGSPFVTVVIIDSPLWIGLALNMLVSIARFLDLKTITIMTAGREPIDIIFKRLGLYTYNANSTIDKFPPDFRSSKHISSWSWGEIIFLRYNLMIEAFRRRLGICMLDVDVTINDNIFGKSVGGKFFDIVVQGDRFPANKSLPGNKCTYSWVESFRDNAGYYLNLGISCHAYSPRMLAFIKAQQKHVNCTIANKIDGWGQKAYTYGFCKADFKYLASAANATNAVQWRGVLNQYNLSVSLFRAGSKEDLNNASASSVLQEGVRVFHPKGCHGGEREENRGKQQWRAKCKYEWLKEQGQWMLPPNIPTTWSGWLALDKANVSILKKLLFPSYHPSHSKAHN